MLSTTAANIFPKLAKIENVEKDVVRSGQISLGTNFGVNRKSHHEETHIMLKSPKSQIKGRPASICIFDIWPLFASSSRNCFFSNNS